MRETMIKIQPSSQGKSHPDYRRNLETSQNFIIKTHKSWLKGMEVKILDTHLLTKSILSFIWIPPREVPLGNFATPISLHQKDCDFNEEIETVSKSYMRMARDFLEKNPGHENMTWKKV